MKSKVLNFIISGGFKMVSNILYFQEIDNTKLLAVGGKGLNLGKLSKIDGIRVPRGFCVTTEAYRTSIEKNAKLDELFDKLTKLKSEDKNQIAKISNNIRLIIENLTIPKYIESEIIRALSLYDEQQAYAVRSSATAEDLPNASFAGQQDTYLNIKGETEVLRHIIKCWASLFTDRAVTYRIQNNFDHRKVLLSVVVQEMIMSEISGIMFTADPMTSDRKTLSIEAGFGLGEALVSGLVNPDVYKVQDGMIVDKSIGTKDLEIHPNQGGGIEELKIDSGNLNMETLKDEQIQQLAYLGKKIEFHFGCPQDIEWCLVNNKFHIVQARPITTLFPIPKSSDPKQPRVFMSIGHTQMMTDAIKPLGMSFFEMITQSSMNKAGGRIFADITHDLSSMIGQKRLIVATGKQDPLIQNVIKQLIEDKTFSDSLPRGKRNIQGGIFTLGSFLETIKMYRKNDLFAIEELLDRFEKEVTEVDKQLSKLSGTDVVDFIHNDRDKLLAMAYNPTMLGAIIAGILVNDWINKKVQKWLGKKNVTDVLSKSVKHNITTEMGLALCDVADTFRKYPQVLDYICNDPTDENFFEKMVKIPGGQEPYKSFKKFLDRYGMRCPGEIDITKDRWGEKPTQLISMLLNNIRVLETGEHKVKFQIGKQEAQEEEDEIIRLLKNIRGGHKKANKLQERIRLLRNFVGCREYPKYYIVRRYQIYKKSLLKEADNLVNKGIIKNREDIFYLYFDELSDVLRTNKLDYSVIEIRKNDYDRFEKMTPPRVITSTGFVPTPESLSDNLPINSIWGIPVSSGVVEGRARVVLSVNEANLEDGDILVTKFTDPSWTPLFVTAKGVVTEVGGFTTHGAVITREYGLPGVVGVENATKLIKDGQMIRVNGTEGYVEVLE